MQLLLEKSNAKRNFYVFLCLDECVFASVCLFLIIFLSVRNHYTFDLRQFLFAAAQIVTT